MRRGQGSSRAPLPRARAASVPRERRSQTPPDPERVLARQPWGALLPLLEAVGAPAAETLERLKQYARALLEWNRGVSNLVSRHDESRVVARHLAESLQPARRLRDLGVKRVLDFGSGAGLPAIPLALAGIGENWTLVESRRNKTLFMRKVLGDLALGQIDVVTARLEVAVDNELAGRRFDGFTSRATTVLGPTLELAQRVLAPGGHAILWKGSGVREEAERSQPAWSTHWDHIETEPLGDGLNTLAIFKLR